MKKNILEKISGEISTKNMKKHLHQNVWLGHSKKTTWQNSELMQSAENMFLNVISFNLPIFVQNMVVEISFKIVIGKVFFWTFRVEMPLQTLFGRIFV